MRRSTLQFTALLLSFFCVCNMVTAQLGSSKWQYSNPKPFGFVSYQIAYADNNNALVVGEAGGIAKTTDGGGTWSYFAYTTTSIGGDLVKPTFNDVQFVTNLLVYAVGDDGIMIKSIDGGTNWTPVVTPFYSITDNQRNRINTVFFTNPTTGYIGGDGDAITNKATIYKTTDGGATWQPEFEFPAPAFEWLSSALYKIRFSATGVGYVGGANGLVWKYENGVWSDYSIKETTVYPNVAAIDTIYYPNWEGGIDTIATTYEQNIFGLDQQNYRAIAILNDTAVVVGTQNNGGLIRINTGTVGGSYLLLNNGSAYAQRYAPLGSPQIYNLATRDGITVAGASSAGTILMSKDAGFNWFQHEVYPAGSQESEISFYGIDITASGRFGMCGRAGIIADSVTQWRRPYSFVKKSLGPFGYAILSTSFADANYGAVAGSGGALLRTADGGSTWEDVSTASFNPWDAYNSIMCIAPNTLLAAASNGQFYKSFDRGATFDLLFNEPNAGDLSAMHFINEDTGWLVANVRYPDNVNFVDTFHQIIYHTYDGGLTWDTSNTVFPYETDYSLNSRLNEIRFFDANIGYAGGDNGTLYKSTDGGINWVKQTTLPVFATDKPINSIAMVDQNIAYVSGGVNFNTGDGGLVMKTVDGGNTWAMCNTGLPIVSANYPKILMYDASQGLLFGRAAVYSTQDAGASWTPYHATLGGFSQFSSASFAPIAGCSSGICKKVFAGAGANIMKLDADIVLPVKFSSLTGTGTTEGNQLFWTAFAQESVLYFEVEHAVDGATFRKISDKVYPGALNYQSYQWLDANAATGRNYYRIKATERSGAVFYTNIVMIASRKPAKWNHVLSNGGLILTNAKVQKGNVHAMLVNAAGQTIAAKSWNQDAGAFNQVLVLPPAAKGVHFVKIDNEGSVYSFKIFIQ